jgi:diguanylate cyclase (GGDEF)-like protein
MGGDEFAVILEVLKDRNYAEEVAVRIENELSRPFSIDGKEITIGASVGIALCPDDTQDPEALLINSDKLMYQAKKTKYAENLGWKLVS